MKKSFYILISLLVLFLFAGCSEVEEKIKGTEETSISDVETTAKSITLPTELYPYENINSDDPLKYILRDNSGMDTYYFSNNNKYIDKIEFIHSDGNSLNITLDSEQLPVEVITPDGTYTFNFQESLNGSHIMDRNFTDTKGVLTQQIAMNYTYIMDDFKLENTFNAIELENNNVDNSVLISKIKQSIFIDSNTQKLKAVKKAGLLDPLLDSYNFMLIGFGISTGKSSASCNTDDKVTDCEDPYDEFTEAYKCLQVYEYKYLDSYVDASTEETCKSKYLVQKDSSYYINTAITSSYNSCLKKLSKPRKVLSNGEYCKFSEPEHKKMLDPENCNSIGFLCEEISSSSSLDSQTCLSEENTQKLNTANISTGGFANTTSRDTLKCYSDKDDDGIIDDNDRCPEVTGEKHLYGCPDSDGDSIIDKEDGCPSEYGSIENNGCPQNDVIVLNLTDKKTDYIGNSIPINTNTKVLYNIKIEDIGKFNINFYGSDTNLEVSFDGEDVDNIYTNKYIKEGEYIVSIENTTDNNLTFNFSVTLSEFADEDRDGVWDGEDICIGTPSIVTLSELIKNDGCANISKCSDIPIEVPIEHRLPGQHNIQTDLNSGLICGFSYTNYEARDYYIDYEIEAFFYENENPALHAPVYDGDYNFYVSTGLKRYIPYTMGVIEGEVLEYHNSGALSGEIIYKDNEECSHKYYYENGIKSEANFDPCGGEMTGTTITCPSGKSEYYPGESVNSYNNGPQTCADEF